MDRLLRRPRRQFCRRIYQAVVLLAGLDLRNHLVAELLHGGVQSAPAHLSGGQRLDLAIHSTRRGRAVGQRRQRCDVRPNLVAVFGVNNLQHAGSADDGFDIKWRHPVELIGGELAAKPSFQNMPQGRALVEDQGALLGNYVWPVVVPKLVAQFPSQLDPSLRPELGLLGAEIDEEIEDGNVLAFWGGGKWFYWWLLCSVPIATEKELSMADGVFNVEALAV